MGIAFGDIVPAKEISIDSLSHKVIAIDSHNILYQFLTTIRGPDGMPFTDSKGRVTSHLLGLFNRTVHLLQKNIKPVFVFDGTPPALKQKTLDQRKKLKEEAREKLEIAKEKEDLEEIKKFSARTTYLTKDMISEAKEMLSLLGVPVVQAPSEGEAQASLIVQKGDAYAVGSQDYDSLINGASLLVRNLSVAGKRKKGQFGYVTVKTEMIELEGVLNELGLDQNQLRSVAMLVGTDYNPGGVKGIGPKNAIKLAKKYGSDREGLFKEAKWDEHNDVSFEELFDLLGSIPTTEDYSLEWNAPSHDALVSFLSTERNFSQDRIESTLTKLKKETQQKNQMSLTDF